jgi:hypothetical protein
MLRLRLCPSSGILETRKHNFSESGCFQPQVRGEDTYSVPDKVQKPSNFSVDDAVVYELQ